jgi:hypothetical protein
MQRRTVHARSAEKSTEPHLGGMASLFSDFRTTPFAVTDWISYLVLAQGVVMV